MAATPHNGNPGNLHRKRHKALLRNMYHSFRTNDFIWRLYRKRSNQTIIGINSSVQYNDVKFVPNYELYRGEVIFGADIVSLNGTKSRTCKIKGKKKGNAVIRITYEYGKDEPDVLTGIDRNVNHTKTKLYRIKVVS